MIETGRTFRTFTDNEAAAELKIPLRRFKTMKAHYHKLWRIKHRGLHGYNVDEKELEVIRKAIEIERVGVKAHDEALKLAVAERAMPPDGGSPPPADVLQALFCGDGSAAERAFVVLHDEFGEAYERFLEATREYADALRDRGSDDLAQFLNNVADTLAKAAAFDVLHRNGKLRNSGI